MHHPAAQTPSKRCGHESPLPILNLIRKGGQQEGREESPSDLFYNNSCHEAVNRIEDQSGTQSTAEGSLFKNLCIYTTMTYSPLPWHGHPPQLAIQGSFSTDSAESVHLKCGTIIINQNNGMTMRDRERMRK